MLTRKYTTCLILNQGRGGVTTEVNFKVSRLQSLFFCLSSQTFILSLDWAHNQRVHSDFNTNQHGEGSSGSRQSSIRAQTCAMVWRKRSHGSISTCVYDWRDKTGQDRKKCHSCQSMIFSLTQSRTALSMHSLWLANLIIDSMDYWLKAPECSS